MLNITIEGKARALPVAFLLLAAVLLVGGCDGGDNGKLPVPTATLLSLSPPTPAVSMTPEGETPSARVAPPTSTAVSVSSPMLTPEPGERATATAYMDEQATAQVERQKIPMPVQTNEATVAPASVSITEAWGSFVGRAVPITVDADHLFSLFSVDPDGQFVVGAIVPRAVNSKEPGRLVMVGVGDGHITEIASYNGLSGIDIWWPPSLLGADTDGEWVAWNEYAAVRAYNIKTGAKKTLTEKTLSMDKSPVAAFRAPRVDHGLAVWQELALIDYKSSIKPTTVYRADLATGGLTTLSDYGSEPVISWPIAGWVQFPQSGEGVNDVTRVHKGVITLLNLETGVQTSLKTLEDPSSFTLSGDALVYSRTSGQAFMTDLAGQAPRLISPDYSSPYHYLSMNDRIVSWVYNPSRVYDRAQSKLVSLTRPWGMRLVKGHTLAWQEAPTYVELEGLPPDTVLPNDQTVYVVDTSQLRK